MPRQNNCWEPWSCPSYEMVRCQLPQVAWQERKAGLLNFHRVVQIGPYWHVLIRHLNRLWIFSRARKPWLRELCTSRTRNIHLRQRKAGGHGVCMGRRFVFKHFFIVDNSNNTPHVVVPRILQLGFQLWTRRRSQSVNVHSRGSSNSQILTTELVSKFPKTDILCVHPHLPNTYFNTNSHTASPMDLHSISLT